MKRILDNKGMTLQELMVVLALMGIIAALAIPNFYAMKPKMNLNSATSELSGDIQWARTKAVADNSLYVVAIDIGNNTYTVYKDINNTFDTTHTATVVKTVDLAKIYVGVVFGQNVSTAPSGLPFTAGDKAVFADYNGASSSSGNIRWLTFRPDGTPVYSGVVYLIVASDIAINRKDRLRAITVESMTGMVRTWQYDTKNNVWGS